MDRNLKRMIATSICAVLSMSTAHALTTRHRPERRPDHMGHGYFVGSKMFQLTNFAEIELQTSGTGSFTMKSWAGRGDANPPCVEFTVNTSAGVFRIDDIGTGQYDFYINDKMFNLSPGHHTLIEKSGAIKIIEGYPIPFDEVGESGGVTIENVPDNGVLPQK